MRYNIATLANRARKTRRASITLRDIKPPATLATNLYQSAYAPIVALWAEAVPAIVAEYERTISQTTDSPNEINEKIEAAQRNFSVLSIVITPQIQRWALRIEKWYRGKWGDAILSATTVDISAMIGPSDVRKTLDATINYNVSLIKDVSAEAQKRMSAIIYDGLRNVKPAREVAKQLREAVGLSKARSIRIASDQLSKLTSALADERRREAGIDKWKWLHSGKRYPRADHKARDGKEYSDESPPPDMPGQLPFCGCRSQGVIVFE